MALPFAPAVVDDDEDGTRATMSLFDTVTVEEDEHAQRAGAPLWVVTFADMVLLLLAFFVLVLSFSDLNENRFRDVTGSLQKSLGKQDAMPSVVAPPAETQLVAGPTEDSLPIPEQLAKDFGKLQKELSTDLVGKKIQLRAENGKLVLQLPDRSHGLLPQELIDLYARIADAQAQLETPIEVREGGDSSERLSGAARQFRQLRELLAKEIDGGEAQVERDGERIVIRLVVQGSFYSGSADLSPDFMPMLSKVGQSIAKTGGRITIEGHTDAIPLLGHNRYRSNWDLSGARASSVADYLTGRAGVPRERVVVRGMADTKPVAPNDTRDGRAKNRRIEVLVDAY
jgi:chemotaxis protein MotB